jgi:uncharacterized repeat protein (TIGR01451 family)
VKQGPQRARLNESLTYRLTVTNPASRDLTGVKVTDVLPAGLVHSSGKATLSWDLKSIPAGQSVTVEYQVVAKKEGRLCNKAEVRADGGLREEATSCVMVGDARMTLAKTGPKVRYLNIPVTYLLTVTNPGKLPLANVVITDPVPAAMTFVKAGNGGQQVDNEVRWQIGALEPGQSRTVQVVMQARNEGKVLNRAVATAEGGLSAQAEAQTQFKGASALLVELVDTEDPVEVGAETSYRITIKNQGMVPATNIKIKAVIPAAMILTRARGPSDNRLGDKTAEGQVLLFEPLKALAPGATVIYEVFVRAQKAGDVRFKVDVTADQLKAGGPVHEEESTAIFTELAPMRSQALRGARFIWAHLPR